MPALPEGLSTRHLTPADSRAVFEVMAAQQLDDIGRVEIEEADIVSDWARPSHDLAGRSIAVLDHDDDGAELMVGYAEQVGADRVDAAVRPSHGGRGIGTWLAAWLRETARGNGASVIGMPVPEGSPGDRLLESLGYHVRWTSWVLRLPDGASIPDRPLPGGYGLRAAEPEEWPAVHEVVEDAFLEWSEREREPYDDFVAALAGRPGFAPWNLRVAVDPDSAVVGMALVLLAGETAYVDRLAVRRDRRRQGLAQALLVDAFAAAREHGAHICELSTDSRTGALGLYEKVGMRVTDRWVNRAIRL